MHYRKKMCADIGGGWEGSTVRIIRGDILRRSNFNRIWKELIELNRFNRIRTDFTEFEQIYSNSNRFNRIRTDLIEFEQI
jgi:hypothetical protein